MSDAFRDAELCAAALDDVFAGRRGFADAMAGYQRTRDARSLPMFDFTTQLATLEAPPPDFQRLLAAVAHDRDAMDAFASMVAGTISPGEFFDPTRIEQLMLVAHNQPAAST